MKALKIFPEIISTMPAGQAAMIEVYTILVQTGLISEKEALKRYEYYKNKFKAWQ